MRGCAGVSGHTCTCFPLGDVSRLGAGKLSQAWPDIVHSFGFFFVCPACASWGSASGALMKFRAAAFISDVQR